MMRITLFGLLASMAAAQSCQDLTKVDGSAWNDDGGAKYNCNWYNSKRCQQSGNKYPFQSLVANQACCVCGGGSTSDFAQNGGQAAVQDASACQVDNDWVHPVHKDSCEDYISGPSKQYNCEKKAKQNCCTCLAPEEPTEEEEVSGTCTDKTVDGDKWHDAGGANYDCKYYGKKSNRCSKDGDKYEKFGMTANDACCVCNGGDDLGGSCEDMPGPNDGPWHDSGGAKYNCAYYSKNNRCTKEGDKYTSTTGTTANQACCVCGGGIKDLTTEATTVPGPFPDVGDDIQSEGLGGIEFFHKKHLQGGFILYWNVDATKEETTFGLLSGPDSDGWISLGFSELGGMAGSDAVMGWFDDDGEAVISDKFLKNQSPSGVMEGNRQQITGQQLFKIDDRMALVFTRPWFTSTGGVEIRATTDFALAIYATGAMSNKCNPAPGICNHEPTTRFQTELAVTAPDGLSVAYLNRGMKGEPCQGVANLLCNDGFTCYHADAPDLDFWAPNYETYGTCESPQELEEENYLEDDWEGIQTVFANDGGFDNVRNLRGGFVLMFTVNRVSEPGSYSEEDTITLALVSTRPDKQGWLGFGWSPNGEMKGSDVVIGWSAEDNEHIGDYYLGEQVSAKNYQADKQNLVNARVIRKNSQTAITFERKLTPEDSVQILEGLNHVIYASGPLPEADEPDFIPYHRFRRSDDIEFMPIAGELEDANAVGYRKLCAGAGKVKCKSGLVCNLFDMDLMQRMQNRSNSSRNDWDKANTTGFTSASSWGTGGKGKSSSNSFWSNRTAMMNAGLCIKPEDTGRWQGWSESAKVQAVEAVRNGDYINKQKLRWGFEIYWTLLDANGQPLEQSQAVDAKSIRVAVVASIGPGWLGIGFGTEGAMTGSSAVLGWVDNGNTTNKRIGEYYLQEKLPWKIRPITEDGADGMEIISMDVVTQGHETALLFERPLEPSNGVAPILPGPTTLIFAVGNTPRPSDDYFGYHRFRDVGQVTFVPY